MTHDPPNESPSVSGRHSLFEFGGPSNERRSPTTSEFRGRLHRSFRAAIRGDQMALDRMVSRLDLARREDYGLFLNAHYLTLRDLSAAWRDEDHEDFSRMTHCLQEDLQSIGFPAADMHSAAHRALTTGAR